MYDEGALVGLCMRYYTFKCLHAEVTICATIVAHKFDFCMLTPLTSKNRSNCGESVGASTSDVPMVQIWRL